MTVRPLRVALLVDRKAWVLSTVAEAICRHAGGRLGLTFEIQPAPQSRSENARFQGGFDLLHFLSPGDFYRLAPAVVRPSVVTVHHVATRIRERFPPMAGLADAVTSTNEACGAFLRELPELRGKTVWSTPLGIDADFFRPIPGAARAVRERFGIPDSAKLIGLSAKTDSNEDDRKGFDRYWALLRSLAKDEIRLLILGPGPDQTGGWREELIPEDVRPKVVLAGFQPFEELPRLYSALDFYVCLSRIEGGPYPVKESMACETPVISTPVGVVPSLIEDGQSGFIVDESNFIARTTQLLRAPRPDAVGKSGRTSVVAKISWATCASAERYRGIYDAAVENWKRRGLTERVGRGMRDLLARVKR